MTRIVAYPIPRCDSAINEEFGLAIFFWLWDAPMGYHQLAVALASQEKLAFQGPDAIKWTYTVMPFGPTNRPATFINFIHDVNSQRKVLAQQSGLVIDDDTNTKIIVDDIFSWSDFLEKALLYMKCQLRVCQANQLSLSLCKSCIFSKRFEFVGIDVCPDGNCPAMSKHQLLEHWPQAVISLTQKQICKYTKEPLGTYFFGWCLLYFQAMPCDFVRPTNMQIDKYK